MSRPAHSLVHVVNGRWRPIQGAMHVLVVVIGVMGLARGPIPGGSLEAISAGSTWVATLWYASLLLGGVAATAGEVAQLRAAAGADSPGGLANFLFGLMIERVGVGVLGAVLLAYSVAIWLSPAAGGSATLFILALGFLGRCGQITLDLRRIRAVLRAAI